MLPKTTPVRSRSLPVIPSLFPAQQSEPAPEAVLSDQVSPREDTVFDDGEPLAKLSMFENIDRHLRLAKDLPQANAEAYMAEALMRLIPAASNKIERGALRCLISDGMLQRYPDLQKALDQWPGDADL